MTTALLNFAATHDIDVVALTNLFDLLNLEGCGGFVFLTVEVSTRKPTLGKRCANDCSHILGIHDWELTIKSLLIQQRYARQDSAHFQFSRDDRSFLDRRVSQLMNSL